MVGFKSLGWFSLGVGYKMGFLSKGLIVVGGTMVAQVQNRCSAWFFGCLGDQKGFNGFFIRLEALFGGCSLV